MPLRLAVLDDDERYARTRVDWSALPADIDVTVLDRIAGGADAVADALAPFDLVLAMRERTPLPRALLEQLPRLQLLVTTGMYNAAIDVDAATELGIVVAGAPGTSSGTAELTWALILGLLRHVTAEAAAVRAGRWGTTVGVELEGLTLGLLGLGRLGSRVARVGNAFGMQVLAWSRTLTPERADEHGATAATLDEVLQRSDVVSVHLRLNDGTRGLLGAPELARMRPTAVLVNTSRGPIVDEAALVDALSRGTIAGAGLDVFDTEPLPAGHPLTTLPNTLLLPHRGYVTDAAFAAFHRHAIESIAAFVAGRPVRVLNPEVVATPALRAGHVQAPPPAGT